MFLTGQAEVHSLCRRLRKAFPFRKGDTATGERSASSNSDVYLSWDCGSVYLLEFCIQLKLRKPKPQRQ